MPSNEFLLRFTTFLFPFSRLTESFAQDHHSLLGLLFIIMTHHQIKLVQHSWLALRGIDPHLLGDVFYSRLFYKHPALRKMFPADMKEQQQKLIEMIGMMVARLEKPAELAEMITALGSRHVAYGTKPVHYRFVAEALMWTLEKAVGKEWNPELAEAWKTCYREITEAMTKPNGTTVLV